MFDPAPARLKRAPPPLAIELLAFQGDDLPAAHEVLAQVNPDNGPSTRVVRSLGFQHQGLATDADGDLLAKGLFRRPLPAR